MDQEVRLLINPKSGLTTPAQLTRIIQTAHETLDKPGCTLTIQFTRNKEDGAQKARKAVAENVDILLVAGGDGMVHTIGQELIQTSTLMGVIPTGSGNGFARHFNIPTNPVEAIPALLHGGTRQIDVGQINGHPFFVTCSLAWGAAIAKTFEKFPVRGILPYVFAGAYEYFEFRPQPVEVVLDGDQKQRFEDPLLITIANLTQFGGGAKIAPNAKADDGRLELVIAEKKDTVKLVANLRRLFDGSLLQIPEVHSFSFSTLTIHRDEPSNIQLDGELYPPEKEVHFSVLPGALSILVP